MTKELVFYVSKQLISPTYCKFLLRTSLSAYVYSFNELPVLENPTHYHDSFRCKIGDVLHNARLKKPQDYIYNVKYNQEYKSSGNAIVYEGKDHGIYYKFEKQINEVPMEKDEIFHFMKLFQEFRQ